MSRHTLSAIAVVFFSTVAAAQSSDHVEIFGGYTFMRPDFSLVNPDSANGWNASVDFKVTRWIGAVADFSGFYPSSSNAQGIPPITDKAYTFLFGPQVSLRFGRVAPFARFLTGLAHVTPQSFAGTTEQFFQSNNGLALAAGGGIDCRVTRRIALRAQADWLYAKLTPIGGGDPGVNYVRNRNVARVSTGVVFRF